MAIFLSIDSQILLVILILASLGCRNSRGLAEGIRHAYIKAIPFRGMRLAAPVLTSLSNMSPRQCGLDCLDEERCQSFNYRTSSRSCDLLSDYLCSDLSELVQASGYQHYDVEKDGSLQNMSRARADEKCQSDARCSPKCSCSVIAFTTYKHRYLTPDNQTAASVPEAETANECMALCAAKPLPQCRGVNTMIDGTHCQHLTFVRSERPSSRYIADRSWDYHKRHCFQ